MKTTNCSPADRKAAITGQKLKFRKFIMALNGALQKQIEPGKSEKVIRPYGYNQDYII